MIQALALAALLAVTGQAVEPVETHHVVFEVYGEWEATEPWNPDEPYRLEQLLNYVEYYYYWLSSKRVQLHMMMIEGEPPDDAEHPRIVFGLQALIPSAGLFVGEHYPDCCSIIVVKTAATPHDLIYILIHELGHYFGWEHSGSCVRDGTEPGWSAESCAYDNPDDFMSGLGFVAPERPQGDITEPHFWVWHEYAPGKSELLLPSIEGWQTSCDNLQALDWPTTDDRCVWL